MLPVRITWYSVVPFVKSSDIDVLVLTNVPCADACRMNEPLGPAVPCPVIVVPNGSIWADPDSIV